MLRGDGDLVAVLFWNRFHENMTALYRRPRLFVLLFAILAIAGTASANDSERRLGEDGVRVGIIGLDTSHSPAFAKIFNESDPDGPFEQYQVVAAYPHGSRTIESSYSRIPEYTEAVQSMGVEIVDSIDELLERVDVVLLETNDGRRHLEQALKVFRAGTPVFIDKPLAASLAEAVAIYEAAERYDVPVFTSSSLRYMETAQSIRDGEIGDVVGADAYSPAVLEETHPDLYWYGIHGVETLFTVMNTGCKTVRRVSTEGTDVIVGTWEGGRIGTVRGLRDGDRGYGGTAFGTDAIARMGPYEGYRPLVVQIERFLRTGDAPVSRRETLEIYAFMTAADESKRLDGAPVSIEDVLEDAREEAERILASHD